MAKRLSFSLNYTFFLGERTYPCNEAGTQPPFVKWHARVPRRYSELATEKLTTQDAIYNDHPLDKLFCQVSSTSKPSLLCGICIFGHGKQGLVLYPPSVILTFRLPIQSQYTQTLDFRFCLGTLPFHEKRGHAMAIQTLAVLLLQDNRHFDEGRCALSVALKTSLDWIYIQRHDEILCMPLRMIFRTSHLAAQH